MRIAIICESETEFKHQISKIVDERPNATLSFSKNVALFVESCRVEERYQMVQINPHKPGVGDAIQRQTRAHHFDFYRVSKAFECWNTIDRAMRSRIIKT